MKHILFILGSYYPYYSAVGKCVGNIADVFSTKSDTYQVSVICCMSRPDQPSIEHYKNQTIIRISTPYIRAREHVEGKIQRANGINKKMLSIWHQCLRAYGVCRIVFASNSLQKDLVKAYLSAINNLQEKPDIIIPSCTPFETIISALEYKEEKPDVAVVPILFDKFADSETLHRFAWNKKLKMQGNLNLEHKMMEDSDGIYHVFTWTDHINEQFLYLNYKAQEVEHPLIVEQKCNHAVKYEQGKIHIVYTGVLDLSNRNPQYVLDLFSDASEKSKLVIHFYSLGNAQTVVNKYAKECPDRFVSHGSVNYIGAVSAMNGATILLSIGNKDTSQLPSKIFEYMSCGKPIIHVAYSRDDPAIAILIRYPLSYIIIKNDRHSNTINLLEDWCFTHRNCRMSFEEVQKLFFNCTPEYIQSTIEQKISEL